MKYIAVHNKILAKELKKEEEIITYEPEGSLNKNIRAEVISAGAKVKEIYPKQIIHFLRAHARQLTLDGSEYFVIEDDKIMVAELGKGK